MKRTLFTVALVISLVVLVSKFIFFLPGALGAKETAGLQVQSVPEEADVFIDGVNVGRTPFESDNLQSKEITVKLTSAAGEWTGKVTLGGRTITYINRDLAKDTTESAGEILTLEKGSGATVISSPTESTLSVDGQTLGQAPGNFQVEAGEHSFVLSHSGFINRNIKAKVPTGYNLKLVVDLASSSEEATAISASPSPSPSTSTATVVVLATPTGFLRVRDRASTAGLEIARVTPGDILEFVETSGSWTKVKLPDGREGFVSSQYVSKR